MTEDRQNIDTEHSRNDETSGTKIGSSVFLVAGESTEDLIDLFESFFALNVISMIEFPDLKATRAWRESQINCLTSCLSKTFII